MPEGISAGVSEAEKLNALTGMETPAEELSDEQSDTKPESEPKPEPPAKPEEGKPDEDGDDDEEGDEEGEDEEPNKKPLRSARNERPIKSAFKQIKELRGSQKQIMDGMTQILSRLDSMTSKQQEAVIDDIKALADKRGLDPEGLADIIDLAEKRLMDKLEKSGKLNNNKLPEEDQELLEQVREEQSERQQSAIFTSEWNLLLPELQKQFPNAKANEINEARELMYNLARSEQGVILNKKGEVVANRELDYILFKNRSKFETILKVAKAGKSGETSSKQITDDVDEEDIDLDPENMDPEKMKRYQNQKYKS